MRERKNVTAAVAAAAAAGDLMERAAKTRKLHGARRRRSTVSICIAKRKKREKERATHTHTHYIFAVGDFAEKNAAVISARGFQFFENKSETPTMYQIYYYIDVARVCVYICTYIYQL